MGKYIPVQKNCDVHGDVVIEISDNTMPGLILPEIVYNVKRKIGCIFIENHNSVSLDLQRGQTIGGDVMHSDARRSRSTIREA